MRGLKKLAIVSGLILILVSLFNASLFAQEGPGSRQGPPQREDPYKLLKTENIDTLAEKLSLDKTQTKKVEEILSESEEKIKELNDKMDKFRLEMQEFFRTMEGPPDQEVMTKMRAETDKIRQELNQAQQDMAKKVKEVLKDEQKEKLDDLLDPALQRRMKSIRDALKLEEDESTIMPVVKKILNCQKEFSAKYNEKIKELEQVLANKDKKPDEYATLEVKLEEAKKIVAQYNAERKKLEEGLAKSLTPEQEALLLTQGVLGGIPRPQGGGFQGRGFDPSSRRSRQSGEGQ